MGGREIEIRNLGNVTVAASQALNAARHVADRIAAEHPHELDDCMPRLAGRLTGQNPAVADGLLELLDALGLPTTAQQLRALKARAAIEAARKQRSKETP